MSVSGCCRTKLVSFLEASFPPERWKNTALPFSALNEDPWLWIHLETISTGSTMDLIISLGWILIWKSFTREAGDEKVLFLNLISSGFSIFLLYSAYKLASSLQVSLFLVSASSNVAKATSSCFQYFAIKSPLLTLRVH